MAEPNALQKILGTIGETAKATVKDYGVGPGSTDLTPGYSIRDIWNTQTGKIGGGGDKPTTPQFGGGGSPSISLGGAAPAPTNSGGYTGGGGAGSDVDTAAEMAALDEQEGYLRSLLGRSGTLRSQGTAQLNQDEALQRGKAELSYSRGMKDYNTKEQDTQRERTSALDRNETGARVQANSVRNIIARAAGGGASALDVAGEAVARNASDERGDVMDDFAANFRDLGEGKRRLEQDVYDPEKGIMADIARQTAQKSRDLEEGIVGQEQGVVQTLEEIARKRKALQGGSYNDMRAAGQPYRDEYNKRSAVIDSLFEKFKGPQITSREVDTTAPQLRDYVTGTGGGVQRQAAPGVDPTSPYAPFMKREEDEDKLY
jgi:hypothetical protein